MKYNDTIDGAIIADPILAIDSADVSVRVLPRRVRSWYGTGGVWVTRRVCGVLDFAAIMTPIGWASAP